MPASANEAWAQALTSISARFVLAFAGIFLAAGGWLSWQMSSVDLLTPDWLDAGLSLNLLLP
jgi:TRAP-type C4-dicarboxylate transport system permease small subunit